jgi:hypothetical protein
VEVYILDLVLDGGQWPTSRPIFFTPPTYSRGHPLDKRLGELKGQVKRCDLSGNGTLTVQPVTIPTELYRHIKIKHIQELNFAVGGREEF